MGGIYLGNALLTHSKVENIIQDNDFYIKADGNNINWVDKEVCMLNISEPTNFTLNDILVAKQEYRDIILQIDNLDTNGVKITNYLVLESFNSNTLINQFSNDNFIATINSNATITLQKNIKAAPIEDYIVATDEGELTTELPETFGGRTADEYALKSDLENIGGGGSISSNCVSWNALIGKATEGNLEKYIYYQNDNEIFENGTSDGIYATTFSCYELMGASDNKHIGINIDGIEYTDTIGNFKNNDIINGEYPVSLDIHYEGNGINLVDISYYGNSKPSSIQLYVTHKGMNTIKPEYLPRLSEIMRLPEDESSLNLTLIASAYNSLIDSLTYAGYI